MHVGALVIFDGPPPSRDEFRTHLEARLRLGAFSLGQWAQMHGGHRTGVRPLLGSQKNQP